jgi:metal-responsive CopG/Arc/MetJ family transcriptional regulator
MRIICFKISEDVLVKIDKLALALGMTRSQLIRTALNEYIERHRKELKNITVKKVVKL